MSQKKNKVYVGMSGGVDSSVAAALLLKEGYDVRGVHMKCWTQADECAKQDLEDAGRVAEELGIPFYVWNFEKEYKERVVDYMIDGYRRGITPNPDVMCNREIKFGIFLEKALEQEADFVATGHYCRLKSEITNNKRSLRAPRSNLDATREMYQLWEAKDTNKDQSYFLWTLTQDQLKHALFPIGGYTKPEVRELAKKFALATAEKKDSQGVCFMGPITLDEFLEQYIPNKAGDVVTVSGKKVGTHKGINYYTIGQRHGLGIGGGTPYYVAEKDIETNTIVVAEGDRDDVLYENEVEISDINLIHSLAIPEEGLAVFARVRYRQPLQKATIYKIQDKRYRIQFKEPTKFVAEGQSAVFYSVDPDDSESREMLGGGIIMKGAGG